jgi:uncharacterized Zn finger protein (UPF0148 family)
MPTNPGKDKHGEPGYCPLCGASTTILHDGPMMERVYCPKCETYEISEDLAHLIERSPSLQARRRFVADASKRKAKKSEPPLRIENVREFIAVAAKEESRKASGDMP